MRKKPRQKAYQKKKQRVRLQYNTQPRQVHQMIFGKAAGQAKMTKLNDTGGKFCRGGSHHTQRVHKPTCLEQPSWMTAWCLLTCPSKGRCKHAVRCSRKSKATAVQGSTIIFQSLCCCWSTACDAELCCWVCSGVRQLGQQPQTLPTCMPSFSPSKSSFAAVAGWVSFEQNKQHALASMLGTSLTWSQISCKSTWVHKASLDHATVALHLLGCQTSAFLVTAFI